jgi:23S rRNA pseudouridine1911/1915/1917 synthase
MLDDFVIYEDNHLLVVNKVAGLLAQPNDSNEKNLTDHYKLWLKEKYKKEGNVFLQAVYRLDKPVSGVFIFAKTSKALSRLNEEVREKRTKKIYQATVEGRLPQKLGTLQNYLVHDDYCARIVSKNHPEAKEALLEYTLIEELEDRSIVEIELITGRYHQIRVQLAHIGNPIIGDEKYGSQHLYRRGQIALHHSEYQIQHPITKEKMIFKAPTPPL